MENPQNKINIKTLAITFCLAFFLLFSLQAYAQTSDAAPSIISVTADPPYAGIGDTISITVNASDDAGVKGIYFYSPDSTEFAFMDCAGAKNCTRTASKSVDKTGVNNFCAKAIDSTNQMSANKCVDVEVTLDRPPIVKYFYAEQKDKDKPQVHVGGTVKFFLMAEDDVGISKVYIEDVATGKIEEQNCSKLQTCLFEYKRLFEKRGTFEFCGWAFDTTGKKSAEKCLQVNVEVKYSCEPIMLDDSISNRVVGLTINSRRLYQDVDGLVGYSSECCKEYGYCKDLKIDARTCEVIGGNLENSSYSLFMWDPKQTTVAKLLKNYTYPQIACTTTIGNFTYIGVIENGDYKVLSQVQNLEENFMTYWLSGQNRSEQASTVSMFTSYAAADNATFDAAAQQEVSTRFFLAEQLQKEGNETIETTIVDSVSYSDAMNVLLEDECITKDMESGECQFDCPDYDARCGSPCGGPCLGCANMDPSKCWCCKQCQVLERYKECPYNKYKAAYGRPFVDYLFCWKVPQLKDTAWCSQKSDQPTAAVNYPWYGFTRNESGGYRSLGTITQEYIDAVSKWNTLVEVNEKPNSQRVASRIWAPEVYCDHQFEDKLFREIWTKMFTVTPYLNDLRNNMSWTRTGPGKLFAGGGFRREPACWWECCRRCAPFCNCMCTACNGVPCCIDASFASGVTNQIVVTVTDTTVKETGGPKITFNADRRVVTIDNGVFLIISTSNIPLASVTASFSKNQNTGKYKMSVTYTPKDSYVQFVVDQDIVFSYNLREDATEFRTGIDESFSTSLIVNMCNCVPPVCPATCPAKGDSKPSSPTTPSISAATASPIQTTLTAFTSTTNQTTCSTGTCGASTTPTTIFSLAAIMAGPDSPPSPPAPPGDGSPPVVSPCPCEKECPAGCKSNGACCCCPGPGLGISKTVSVSDGIPSTISIHQTKIESLKQAANEFVDIATGRGIKTGLVAFSNDVYVYSNIAPTLDKSSLHQIINRYNSNAATCISCGVAKAMEFLSQDESEKKYIVVMSDGEPNIGSQDAAGIGNAAKSAGITLHTVALGNTADDAFMERLANAGGGKFYKVVCDCPLDCIYRELSESVDGSTVLVSDVSGSMSYDLDLYCKGGTTPIVYKFGALNISVNGRIDNYLDSGMTTIARSKGNITIKATPDIINEVSLNIDKSSMDFYSLIYPVKHEAYRKQYAHGWWMPGIPYVVGYAEEYDPTDGYIEYNFNDAYGYESALSNYPKQCQQICPSDCTCPDYDIMDVTCVDAGGASYKRSDCVCMPPKGHEYDTPCTSDRTFHEEEGYYFDFAEFETREVSRDIRITGETGTNPQATGNLRGDVYHDPGGTPFNTTYLFVTNPQRDTVSKISSVDCRKVCEINVTPDGSEPINAVVDSRGGVWVAGRSTNGVTWFNETSCDITKTKLGPFIVGKGPRALAVDEKNRLWVANEFDNNVWVMDAQTGDCIKGERSKNTKCPAESKPINVSEMPYSITYDCSGNVWVLCRGNMSENASSGGMLYKINGNTYKIDGNYSVGNGNESYGLATDGAGNIWLTGYTTGKVFKYSQDGSIICQAQAGIRTTGIAVDEENNVWVADSEANKIVKLNGFTCELTGKYESGREPVGVTLDMQGNVWAVDRLSGDAIKINASTGSQICSVDLGLNPFVYGDFAGFALNKKCIGQTIEHVETTKPDGIYKFNFEALNFPYSLITYNESRWQQVQGDQKCYDYCSNLGLLAAPVCSCGTGSSQTGCLKYGDSSNSSKCSTNCEISKSAGIKDISCCCARPSFVTNKANMTFMIHFRDDAAAQTFNLTPARQEDPSYAYITFNVTVRDPSRTICEVSPKNARPGQEVAVNMTLLDALTTKGIPGEIVRIELEGYRISTDLSTDSNGSASLKFTALNQSTKINCIFPGGEDYTESAGYANLNIYGLDRFWSFISPEVLLLLVVVVILAFSYKWFGGRGLDFGDMVKEFKGKRRK